MGDWNGLVSYGLGKHPNGRIVLRASQISAIKNMDWVECFKNWTIWTKMQTKYSATRLILRSRPVGLGLRRRDWKMSVRRFGAVVISWMWSRWCLGLFMLGMHLRVWGMVLGKETKRGNWVGIRSMSDVERARGRKLISLDTHTYIWC